VSICPYILHSLEDDDIDILAIIYLLSIARLGDGTRDGPEVGAKMTVGRAATTKNRPEFFLLGDSSSIIQHHDQQEQFHQR
jgi:hypothetical protein